MLRSSKRSPRPSLSTTTMLRTKTELPTSRAAILPDLPMLQRQTVTNRKRVGIRLKAGAFCSPEMGFLCHR
jgi:hypothetical protein